MNYKKALIAVTIILMATSVVAEIDFRSSSPIDFYNNINIHGNEIREFFSDGCDSGKTIKDIEDNGTLDCVSAGSDKQFSKTIDNGEYSLSYEVLER